MNARLFVRCIEHFFSAEEVFSFFNIRSILNFWTENFLFKAEFSKLKLIREIDESLQCTVV